MALNQVITVTASKFLLKPIPEAISQIIDPFLPILVVGFSPPEFHSENHQRTGKCSAKGPSPSNPATKTRCNLREEGTLLTQVVLETQGDRLGSVEPLLKEFLGLLRQFFFHM